jgi:hypothetical protein
VLFWVSFGMAFCVFVVWKLLDSSLKGRFSYWELLEFAVAVCFGARWLFARSRQMAQDAVVESARLYAPPVDVRHLPADEVLLRGTCAPIASAEDLLRARNAPIETDVPASLE